MQGGEHDPGHHQDQVEVPERSHPGVLFPALQGHDQDVYPQDRGVEHDAPGHLEEHRVGVPHHHGVPDAPGLAQVEEQPDDEHQVADEGRELGRPEQRLELFQVEDIDGRGHGEAAGGQGHPGEHVKADPQAPGVGVVQVSGGAQPKEEPDRGRDEAQHQDDIEGGAQPGSTSPLPDTIFLLFRPWLTPPCLPEISGPALPPGAC